MILLCSIKSSTRRAATKPSFALPGEPQTSLSGFFVTVVDVERGDNDWVFPELIWVLEEEWKPTVGLEEKC